MERKTDAERLADLKARQEQLRQQIIKLENASKQKQRKEDTRRKIIVGAAVMEHARQHPDFAATLEAVLAIAVVRPADKKALTGWLRELDSGHTDLSAAAGQ